MGQFNLKLPEGMLERWREIASKRGMTLAQLIREAVNKDIENGGKRSPDEPVG
jgi:predicted DNA-binding protein